MKISDVLIHLPGIFTPFHKLFWDPEFQRWNRLLVQHLQLRVYGSDGSGPTGNQIHENSFTWFDARQTADTFRNVTAIKNPRSTCKTMLDKIQIIQNYAWNDFCWLSCNILFTQMIWYTSKKKTKNPRMLYRKMRISTLNAGHRQNLCERLPEKP